MVLSVYEYLRDSGGKWFYFTPLINTIVFFLKTIIDFHQLFNKYYYL